MSMKIAPCPNPKCDVDRPPAVIGLMWPAGAREARPRKVICDCGLAGPHAKDEAAAIAAWNSISMGKDGEIDRLRHELQRANEAGQTLRNHFDSVKHQLDHLVSLVAEGRALHACSIVCPIPPLPEDK